MLEKMRWCLPGLLLVCVCWPAAGQGDNPPPPEPVKPSTIPAQKPPPPPDRSKIAITINGTKIPEIAVYRAMIRIPPAFWPKARTEIVNFLIENKLVDLYLERLANIDPTFKIAPKDVQAKIQEVEKELAKKNQKLPELLKRLYMTEQELNEQIVGALRWDRFVKKYAPEAKLKELFTKNKEMFDDSLVRARHLLIKTTKNNKEGLDAARAKIAQLRAQMETQVANEVAKLPAGTDNLARAKARQEALEKIFGEMAKAQSDCPSKEQRGELGWFPRRGRMVEPFARTAFSTPTWQISAPVRTEFGYHLILPTDRKPGRNIKYESVEASVREVYSDRLRDAILGQMKPKAKILVHNNASASGK